MTDISLVMDDSLVVAVRDHFVAITVQWVQVNEQGQPIGEDMITAYSAFVIEIDQMWWLVTAGHVISDPEAGIDAILGNPRVKVRRIALADFFSVNAITKKPTPFTYGEHLKLHIDKDGVDIGLIPLQDFFRMSLEANGIKPLPIVFWDETVPACDAYALIGLPKEESKTLPATDTRSAGLSVLLAMIPLEPLPAPAGRVKANIPRFAAQLLDGRHLATVKGMSGGPIIGLRKTENGLEIACLAVQASWLDSTRTVFGTPLGMVVAAVKMELTKAVAQKLGSFDEE